MGRVSTAGRVETTTGRRVETLGRIQIPPTFTPTSVGAGTARLWVRADLGITLNVGNVSAWGDQSGNGNHLSQGTAGFQPLFVASAVNGLPAVRCDGVDDFLQSGAYVDTEPVTLFVVFKTITNGTAGVHDVLWDGRTSASQYAVNQTAGNFAMLNSNGIGLNSTTVATGTYHYGTYIYNGVSSVSRLDGSQTAAGTIGAAPAAAGGITLGAFGDGSRSYNAEYAEVVQYASVLSAGDYGTVEAYLKARYAL